MNSNKILSAILLGGCSLSPILVAANTKEEAKTSKPNLVFVFSDQQSYDMVGCYGNKQIITPNLDAFASEGIRFINCFSNCPISTPYRGMLMTGQHSLNNGTYTNDRPLVPGHGKKFGEVLRDAGYSTAYIGKWHLLGGDRKRNVPKGEMRYGFDDLFFTNNCTTNFSAEESFYYDESDEKVKFGEWEVYGQTRQAIEYLKEKSKDQDKPFALFVSYHPPHDSGKRKGEDGKMHYRYAPPEELIGQYDVDNIEMRPGTENTPDRRRMYRDYYANNTGVDIAFGRLMEQLKAMGCDDNTIVVFTSDHGDMLESLDSPKPKQVPQDYSNRVPFIIRYPSQLQSQSTSSLLIGAMDIMPTILGLMNLPVPQECQGENLSTAIVTGDEDAVKSIPLWLFPNNGYRGVVTKEFTYTYQVEGPYDFRKNVLYDRKNDIYQLNNLYKDESYAKTREELHALTQEWMAKFGDKEWKLNDFTDVLSPAQWNTNRKLRPIDVLKK